MTGMLHLWSTRVESAAVIAIVVIAIGLILGMVDARRAYIRIGTVLAILVLLLTLPPVLVSLWHALSFWHSLGWLRYWGLWGASRYAAAHFVAESKMRIIKDHF